MGLAVASVQLPEEVLTVAHIPRENMDKECQKMVVMELYRKGYISMGKACEIAGISQWEFFDLNQEAQATIHYDEQDLEADLRLAKEVFK
ncbi:MAG: UPF0175 family protein [bacterium]|nr:UPF0175 family protein [bacterium]